MFLLLIFEIQFGQYYEYESTHNKDNVMKVIVSFTANTERFTIFMLHSVKHCTVEPRYYDPRYNDIPGITKNILCPCKSYSKMYGTEPRLTIFDIILDITMRI